MSVLLVGVSHQSAPMDLLDQIAAHLPDDAQLRRDILSSDFVAETMIVRTCNRIEVVADVARFHGSVQDIARSISKNTSVSLDELTPHLYVHFEDRAVHHLFAVSSGLDSMIVGEQQILGQVRSSLKDAQNSGSAGRVLNEVGQSALRVGKRIHSETGLDRHGASVVSVALDQASKSLDNLAGSRALVVGAGAMGVLAVQTLQELGVTDISITSRTSEKSHTIAAERGIKAVELGDLPTALAEADLAVTATGAHGYTIDAVMAEAAVTGRAEGRLVLVDLALPHDVDPACAEIPGVVRLDLSDLAEAPGSQAAQADVTAAWEIVDEEVSDFIVAQAALKVEPIVVSLRAKADAVLESELNRLRLKHPEMSEEFAEAVENSMRRTMSNLLHAPTVRIKQFASDPDGLKYAEALHTLFDLDPEAVDFVARPQSND
ncbi:MAG: glutamyl-tRNA reductase [Candidatus Nanopelagicales bacterium]